MAKFWIIIPAYNEEKRITKLLEGIKTLKNSPNVLVIDDASKDNTFSIASDKADITLKNKVNLGKGASLKKAINYLLKNNTFDYIITMDADGQHLPSDINKFIKEAEKGEEFIVGNRMQNTKTMPKIRIFTNKLMSKIISFIVGQDIPDTQCGFRLIKKSVLENLRIKSNKYDMESEILVKAAKKGIKIGSIPVNTVYFKNHKSKINPFIDTIRFIRLLTEITGYGKD